MHIDFNGTTSVPESEAETYMNGTGNVMTTFYDSSRETAQRVRCDKVITTKGVA